jgi:hypothetical protein
VDNWVGASFSHVGEDEDISIYGIVFELYFILKKLGTSVADWQQDGDAETVRSAGAVKLNRSAHAAGGAPNARYRPVLPVSHRQPGSHLPTGDSALDQPDAGARPQMDCQGIHQKTQPGGGATALAGLAGPRVSLSPLRRAAVRRLSWTTFRLWHRM